MGIKGGLTMQIRILSFLSAAFVLLVAADFAAAQSHPVADGSVESGEYGVEKQDGAIRLYASFDAEKIYLAVVGRTTGWVAVGADSARMDGAKIFMGYFADGKEGFSTQAGSRHRHSESAGFSALSHAVRESNGTTTMEIVLDRRAFLEPGQTTLDVIYALGSSDTFRQYHSTRGSTRLILE